MQGDSLFDTEVRNNFESIISDLEATRRARSDADSDSEHEDPVDEFWRSPRFEVASPVDIVREVMSHMDLPLAKRWFEPWFITEVRPYSSIVYFMVHCSYAGALVSKWDEKDALGGC